MLIEGIVITINEDNTSHFSVMGIKFDGLYNIVLRPYATSKTYINLLRNGRGLVQVTDDAKVMAGLVIDKYKEDMESVYGDHKHKERQLLNIASTCSEFVVTSVAHNESIRPFFYAECLSWQHNKCISGIRRSSGVLIESSIMLSRDSIIRESMVKQVMVWYEVAVKAGDTNDRRIIKDIYNYFGL
ncbi:MAG: DUF447 family protein [Candidatus Bilamarchaeaceae archaeon]